jgi:hypothetical protein
MQQVELFVVAIILWGGMFAFLFYLLMRMVGIEKQIKIVESQIDGEQ